MGRGGTDGMRKRRDWKRNWKRKEKKGRERKEGMNSSKKRRNEGGRYSKDVLLEYCRNDEQMRGDVEILRSI